MSTATLPAIEPAPAMVRRLILKDWYFNRVLIVSYIVGGALALGLLTLPSEAAFYAGCIVLLTVVISLGIHLVMATVLGERTEQTLAFVMSLPVSPMQYTTAKVAANLLIFIVPWATLTIGTAVVVLGRQAIPDGLLPYATLLMVQLLLSYVLVLGTAIVSESQGWTIALIVLCNLALHGFLYGVARLPGIAETLKGPTVSWSGMATLVLAVQLALCAAALSLTFWAQRRKRHFL